MKIKNFLLTSSIILLLIAILIKFYQFYPITKLFPLYGDLGIQIAKLHFLKTYGFHGNVLNWYNGFTAFEFYPIGWFYFALPIYSSLGNILNATYISLILIYLIAFIVIYKFRNSIKLNRLESVMMFVLFFGSPIFLSYFDIGRAPEIFTWLIFLITFLFVIYYKGHTIDKKFIFIIPFYSLLLVSHIYVFVVSSFLFLGLFLIKRNKERILITLAGILSLILTSIWWIPFLGIRNSSHFETGTFYYSVATELLSKSSIISFNTFILLGWILIISIYIYRTKKLLFYLPSIILSLLLLTRLIVFIPILRDIPASPYTLYFLILTSYLFLRMKLYKKNIFLIALLLLSVSSLVLINWSYRDYNFITEKDSEIIEILPKIEERHIFLFKYNHRLDAYSAIYHNALTAEGGYTAAVTHKPGYLNKLENIKTQFKTMSCKEIKQKLSDLNVKEIIIEKQDLNSIQNCNFTKKFETQNFILLTSFN